MLYDGNMPGEWSRHEEFLTIRGSGRVFSVWKSRGTGSGEEALEESSPLLLFILTIPTIKTKITCLLRIALINMP